MSGRPRRVVIAPDSFKGSIPAPEAAAAIAAGWRSVAPDDELRLIPLADGGEGTAAAIAAADPGAAWHVVDGVRGPDDRPVDARWAALSDGTGIVELAESSGLPLMRVPSPRSAHTYGLGQVIADALDHGATRLVVALGGSASTDGGTGALTALGARFLDAGGAPLPPGGDVLVALDRVDLTGLRPPPPGGVTALTDVSTPLYGPDGAAAVFAPQKGATPEDVEALDAGLMRLATLLGGDPTAPGAGAAGGTGYGLAIWGATLVPGAATVAALVGLPAAVARADLVITGEGRFDATSRAGKVVGHVLDLAGKVAGPVLGRAGRTPVAIVAGQVAAPTGGPVIALADLAGSVEAALADPLRWLHRAGAALAATRFSSP
jgi:glycerate kinase